MTLSSFLSFLTRIEILFHFEEESLRSITRPGVSRPLMRLPGDVLWTLFFSSKCRVGAGHAAARCFTCMVDSSLWKNIWNPKSCAAQCQRNNGDNTALWWGRCLVSSLDSFTSFFVNFKAICQSLIQHSSISVVT